MTGDDENFLSRWSRRKREVAEAPAAAVPATAPSLLPASPEPVEPVPAEALPPVESLNLESDYRAFLQPGVGADLRKAALKKLFSDPHFSFAQMDKLDTYIDDYTIEDPISDEVMKTLDHARHIIFDEKPLAADAASQTADNAGELAAATPPPASAESQGKNDDPRQDS